MAASNPQLGVFQGGQMTDLPAYPGTLDVTALLEIVSPGNVVSGINYKITIAQLALIVGSGSSAALTFVTSGATYNSVQTDTRILVNKTVGSPTTVSLLAGSSYFQPVLVKDLKGDAGTNNITVTFPGTFDGIASPLTINTNFGWIWLNPLPTGNFYDAG
jgi:hypothetical protein